MNHDYLIVMLINFAFTVTMYMLGPLEIMYTQKCSFTKKEAKKIAIINSIVVYILFLFLYVFFKEDGSAPKIAVACFYGWINYLLLSKQTDAERNYDEHEENE